MLNDSSGIKVSGSEIHRTSRRDSMDMAEKRLSPVAYAQICLIIDP